MGPCETNVPDDYPPQIEALSIRGIVWAIHLAKDLVGSDDCRVEVGAVSVMQ